jgi:hypothetical protein
LPCRRPKASSSVPRARARLIVCSDRSSAATGAAWAARRDGKTRPALANRSTLTRDWGAANATEVRGAGVSFADRRKRCDPDRSEGQIPKELIRLVSCFFEILASDVGFATYPGFRSRRQRTPGSTASGGDRTGATSRLGAAALRSAPLLGARRRSPGR